MSDVNVVQLQNDVQTAGTAAANTSAVNKTSAPIEIVAQSVVEEQGNTDVAITNNTSDTSNTTQRSVDELYNAIAAVCTKYGISLSEAKKIGLLERIAGVQQQELLNLPNSEIQKHVKCLEAALQKLSKNGEKIDLEEVIKLANDYNTALKTGWTIEGFEKANSKNHEGINKRISRYYGKDFSKMTKEERVYYLNKYFGGHFEKLIKDGMDPEKAAKLQMQDFGKLLINTPDDQKWMFKEAFASLMSENRYPALKAAFESFETQEARTEFADNLDNETLEAMSEPDANGNRMSSEDMTASFALRAKNQSEEGLAKTTEDIKNDSKEFFEKNKEVLERIANKIKNGEELTEEEKEIKAKAEGFYTSMVAGHMAGAANNQIVSDEVKEQVLNDTNKAAYDLPNYRKVMEQVSAYIKEHPEVCSMSTKEFDKLMDKVTNGNYSTVIKDAQNGTTTELKAPAGPTQTVAETSSYTSSAATTGVNTIQNNVQLTSEQISEKQEYVRTLNQQIQNNSRTNLKTSDNNSELASSNETSILPQANDIRTCLENGGKGFSEFVKSNGATKTVKEVFNNLRYAGQGVIKRTAKMYETFTGDIQGMILKGVNNEGLTTLLKFTKDSTLISLKGETFSNFYATQQVEKAAEEAEDKIQKA